MITADRAAESVARGQGVVVLADTVQAGQSQAAQIGIQHALAHGFDRVVLVPGDTPLLRPADLAGLLSRSAPGVSIVPDRHGTGTNALVLSPPDAIEPSFGPDSRPATSRSPRRRACRCGSTRWPRSRSTWTRRDDLAALSAELEQRRGQAQSTRGALRQLDRTGVAPVRASA